MIELSHVSFSYPRVQKPVLKDVSISIRKGEFVTFIGPSGCGKTTFLKVLANLLPKYHGNILIDGKSPQEFRKKRRYAFIFQEATLLPWRTVYQNIALPLEVVGHSNKLKVEAMLQRVGLFEYQKYYPSQLSGGMQQRVALARGLVYDPELLLMDEPFASIDEISKEHLEEQLLQLWSQRMQTVLFVTHSIAEAVFLSDKVVIFTSKGSIVKEVKIELSRPRNEETRKSELFFYFENMIRGSLRSSFGINEK